MTRKRQRKPDATGEVSLRDLPPELQRRFREVLASPEHKASLQRQAERDEEDRKLREADYQLYLRRQRLQDALDEQRLAAEERRVFGTAERKPTGRPVEITWAMVREARRLPRSDGQKGTQQEVAGQLACTIETVKRRARDNGGWSQA